MGWTVWIKVENDDGSPGDKDEGWADIARAETRKEAVLFADHACELLARNGYDISFLDGWYQDGEEDDENLLAQAEQRFGPVILNGDV